VNIILFVSLFPVTYNLFWLSAYHPRKRELWSIRGWAHVGIFILFLAFTRVAAVCLL
jgi:hypothetical protein